MKRLLAAVALLAFLPNANAQDKAKGDMTHDGELRIRDSWFMNPAANKNANASMNTVSERFKLDLGFKASDKLSANVTLLNNFNFGNAAGTSVNVHDSATTSDLLNVNQAYANWMMSDEFGLKVGRMNYQIADGALISVNDWEPTPYSFEGALGNYEAEFGKIQFFALKFRELGSGITTGTAAAGDVTTSDAERNVYGLNFDLKTMPEVIKGVNVHVLKDASDAVVGQTLAANGQTGGIGRDMMRYGLMGSFAFSMIDLKVWYEAMSGKYHELAAGAVKTDITADGNMMQAEVGANFANFMGSRVFLKWHKDSGNKDNSTKSQSYDSYFNEQHCSAGCMDLLAWGNLTFIEAGLTMKPMDNTDVGLSYWMFSKTEKSTTAATTQGTMNGVDGSLLGKGANGDKSKLGDEIDLWAEHHYNSNLSTVLRLSQFMPGDVYKANGQLQKDAVTQIFLQGKMTF